MLKYIIFTDPAGLGEQARLCLAPVKHLTLALEAQARSHGRQIVAAGFVEWVDGEARTSGFSDSLNLGPRPEDAAFLTVFARQTAAAAALTMNANATHHG
jgi:hypothetical protein